MEIFFIVLQLNFFPGCPSEQTSELLNEKQLRTNRQ